MSSEEVSREVSARVARGTFIILVTVACDGIFAAVFTIVVARLIGSEGFGMIGIAFSLIAILQTSATFGIPDAIARFVSKYAALKRWGAVREVLRTSFKYILLLAITFSASLALFAGPIAANVYHNPNLTTLFRVAALALFFTLLWMGFRGTFQGFQRMKYILLTRLSYLISRIVAAVAFIGLGFFATGALLGGLTGFIVACGISLFFLLFKVMPKGAARKTGKERGLSREILFFSAPLWVGGIATVLLTRLGPLVLGNVVSMEEVGYYTAAFSISIFAASIPGAMGVALLPAVSERWTLGDKKGFSAAVGATLKLFFTLLVPLIVAGIIFSEFIMSLLFGAEFVAGANVLRVLLIVLLLRSMASVNISVLNGIGRPGVGAKVWWSAAGVGVAAIVLLAWTHGALGAAIGLGLGTGLSAFLSGYFSTRLTGTGYPLHLLWRPLLASGAMLGFLFPMRFLVWGAFPAVLAGVVGVLIYAYVFLKLGGIRKSDLEVLKRISSSMGKPRVVEKVLSFLERYTK